MSTKSKAAAAIAALTLVSGTGVVAATATSADASTPSCGSQCFTTFNAEFGTRQSPNFVLDVLRQVEKTGQPLIEYRYSTSDPAEDFTISLEGVTSEFYQAGLVSAAVNLHYGDGTASAVDDPAYEIQYAPLGVDSGLCMGLASTAVANEGVTLQPCGVTSKTVWILDSFDAPSVVNQYGYAPAVNGSDTNFSEPFVLSYPQPGYPTDKPRPQLKVVNLTGSANGSGPVSGSVPSYDLWGSLVPLIGA